MFRVGVRVGFAATLAEEYLLPTCATTQLSDQTYIRSWASEQGRCSFRNSRDKDGMFHITVSGDSGLSDPGRCINDIDFIQEELSGYRIRPGLQAIRSRGDW